MFVAKIKVKLKSSVLDPQGQTVRKTLNEMGYDIIPDVRIGKYIEVQIDTKDRSEAEKIASEVSQKILVNSVIESQEIEVLEK